MKKLFTVALLAILFTTGSLNASQLTVNNVSTSPGQYTTLTAALTAAKAGDTILVSGSGTDYASAGVITISKPVTLLGTGYNPIKDIAITATISQIELSAGSSGTVIDGFNLNDLYSDAGVQINNIVIRRNRITVSSSFGSSLLNDQQGDNWLIQENVFGSNFYYYGGAITINGNNILIKNNIFQSGTGSYPASIANTTGNTNLIFSNNVFFNDGSNGPITFYNALVTNNIFYDSTGADINYFANSSTINAQNNIVWGNPDANPLNIGVNGNTGSGNKLNTNPMFTSLNLTADPAGGIDALNLTSNLALKTTSPGHNAGTDGKDIGLYGGTGAQNPLTGVPPIPQISTMNILNTTVAPGGTLSVAIKAKSSN